MTADSAVNADIAQEMGCKVLQSISDHISNYTIKKLHRMVTIAKKSYVIPRLLFNDC